MKQESDILLNERDTLANLSKDDNSGMSVTKSRVRAIDFEKVKEQYAGRFGVFPLENKVGNKYYPSSVDAVVERKEKVYFIEFKYGVVDNQELHDKAKDSLLIYENLCGNLVDPKDCEFVVAYNSNYRGKPEDHRKDVLPASKNRDLIAKRCMKRSGRELIQFDCSDLKMYFGDVHTYDDEEFDAFLKKVIQ